MPDEPRHGVEHMTERVLPPVVITRPRAQALPLARRLEAIGREAVVFPLLEIHPLPDQSRLHAVLGDIERYDMVAFVSPNAIDAVFNILNPWPRQVTIAVMGEGSRAALARHGCTPDKATIISPADATRTDSQTLLEVLDQDALAGKRVLIVRGETGRELLADSLRERQVQVDQVAAYRRQAPTLDQASTAVMLDLLARSAEWIITSSEALRILVDLVTQAAGDGYVERLQRQRLIVPHARIAETAASLGFVDVVLTGSGDDQLIAALQFHA